MSTDSDASDSGGILLRQTLMSVDECFVYKVPPLAVASSGYKANDWNLAQPLETCGFQVERRNDDLFLLFTLEHHTKLYCVSKIEGGNDRASRSVEPVSDSSRYFVCKISSQNKNSSSNRSMNLGFGFRDREVALDLLGNLQQFKQSIERERQAKELASKTKTIKVMKEGEKLHIKIPGKSGSGNGNGSGHGKPAKPKVATTPRSPGGPFLLKKPPPGADAAAAAATTKKKKSSKSKNRDDCRFSMTDMECPLREKIISTGGDDDQDSVAAVGNQSTAGDLDEFLTDDLGPDGATGAFLNETIDEGDEDSSDDDESGDENSAVAVARTVDGDDFSNINDNDDDDSFQFSELNLDDLDEDNNDNDNDKDNATKEAEDTKEPPAPTSPDDGDGDGEDDDFGDFQEA